MRILPGQTEVGAVSLIPALWKKTEPCEVSNTVSSLGLAVKLLALALGVQAAIHADPLSATPVPSRPVWYGRQYNLIAGEYHARLPKSGLVRIAPFRGNRQAAFSFIFDDGDLEQLTQAVPILNQAGLRGTFALNPGAMQDTAAARATLPEPPRQPRASWEEWQAALAAGHELANHGMHHKGAGLGRVFDDPGLLAEVIQAQRLIAERSRRPCVVFVAGFNSFKPPGTELLSRTHLYWRTDQLGYGHPAYDNTGKQPVGVAFYNERIAERVIKKGKWKVAMIHGITTGFQPVGTMELAEHAAFLASVQDRLWVDAVGTIARYTIEAVSARLAVTGDPGDLGITLTDDLGDPALFDQPLTLVIDAIPAGKVTAERAGKALPCTVSENKILVDAVPGQDPIRVRW